MNKEKLSDWRTNNPSLLPDFIIGGTMKSGTSTLHAILATHPDIFIPDDEVHFFDIDNLFQHREFNFYDEETDKWTYQMVQDNPQEIWDWYLSKFSNNDGAIKGEDSTTYLASREAAKRISAQKKNIKLIFVLRHPTKRTYSQYLHLLRSGRAIYNFENMIKYQPEFLLKRSLYRSQLKRYYSIISEESIRVILFEEFIQDTKDVIRQLCEFLEVEFDKFDEDAFQLHANKTRLPKFTRLQIIHNRIYRVLGKFSKPNALPENSIHDSKDVSLWGQFLEKTHRFINPLSKEEKPLIKKSTSEFLDNFFYNKLQGIDELVGKQILLKWFPQLES